MALIKKLLVLSLFLFISWLPASAKENVEFFATLVDGYSVTNLQSELSLNIPVEVQLTDNVTFAENSIVTADIIDTQRELRWHKSAYILCKLKSYQQTEDSEKIDISDENIYMVARKYTPIDKKEAFITGTEIVTTTAASFVIPGVDIVYFFTKGAIQREKDHNWFKAGVSNAYDNSIFWFGLKGPDIEIEPDGALKLKEVSEIKAKKLENKIAKRREKDAIMLAREEQRQALHSSRKKIGSLKPKKNSTYTANSTEKKPSKSRRISNESELSQITE